MKLLGLTSLFKSVAEPVRLRLLHLLCRAELNVNELVKILKLPQSTVSRHLKVLKDQGLVADRPTGSTTFYKANLEGESNGQSHLRNALNTILTDSPLPPSDQQRLDRALALREQEGDDFFNRLGHRWDALRESCFGPTLHFEALLHLLPAEWTVADLGTGTGYLLPHLGAQFARVIAVDQSREMLGLAQRRVGESGRVNIDLRAGRLEELPIDDSEADLALVLLMLHHLTQPDAALAEIYRILKPEGRVLIAELHPYENEAFRAAMGDRVAGIAPEELELCLATAGFQIHRRWNFPAAAQPEHELAPLPVIYGVIAQKATEQAG